jgi:hypothetical protein
MAELLTIRDAIAGLVVESSRLLRKIIIDAPATTSSALADVQSFATAISAIQGLLLNLETAAPERVTLIDVNYLAVTLTDAVLTFSELKQLLGPPSKSNLRKAWDEHKIIRLLDRLRQDRESLSMVLNVLTWFVASEFCAC